MQINLETFRGANGLHPARMRTRERIRTGDASSECIVNEALIYSRGRAGVFARMGQGARNVVAQEREVASRATLGGHLESRASRVKERSHDGHSHLQAGMARIE